MMPQRDTEPTNIMAEVSEDVHEARYSSIDKRFEFQAKLSSLESFLPYNFVSNCSGLLNDECDKPKPVNPEMTNITIKKELNGLQEKGKNGSMLRPSFSESTISGMNSRASTSRRSDSLAVPPVVTSTVPPVVASNSKESKSCEKFTEPEKECNLNSKGSASMSEEDRIKLERKRKQQEQREKFLERLKKT